MDQQECFDCLPDYFLPGMLCWGYCGSNNRSTCNVRIYPIVPKNSELRRGEYRDNCKKIAVFWVLRRKCDGATVTPVLDHYWLSWVVTPPDMRLVN